MSGMFWSYLKFLITFFFIYYIFYIFYCKTHFAALYSLLTSESSAHLQVPGRTEMEVLALSSSHSAPRKHCWSAGNPKLLSQEKRSKATGLWWGHSQDTREAAALWAAQQTLYSCFLYDVPKKVMCLSPGDESTFWDAGIKLQRTWTARPNQVPGTLLFSFRSEQGENGSAYI